MDDFTPEELEAASSAAGFPVVESDALAAMASAGPISLVSLELRLAELALTATTAEAQRVARDIKIANLRIAIAIQNVRRHHAGE